ncbi:MAG: transposase [Nitrospinota bacterium]
MQVTFGMIEDQIRRQKAAMLDEVHEIIDFRSIEKLLLKMYKGRTGRPPIPPLILFKAILLESWYGLSDVEVVQEIHDRRSFEHFLGMDVRKYHLDDTTLVKFRERLRTSGALNKVWGKVDASLSRKGFIVKQGTIVDSTLKSMRDIWKSIRWKAAYCSRDTVVIR